MERRRLLRPGPRRPPTRAIPRSASWVRGFSFDWKRFHIPPRVTCVDGRGPAVGGHDCRRGAGRLRLPERPLDLERTGVVLGHGDGRRAPLPDPPSRRCSPSTPARWRACSQFADLPAEVRTAILEQWQRAVGRALPPITEDSMPGELPNVMTGRIANVLNLRGPNFITDAACASSFAAIDAADQPAGRAPLRRGAHRRRGPQHGRVHVREVLQDRRAQRHRARGPSAMAPTAS